MDLKPAGLLGEVLAFVIEWLCIHALFGASLGLIAAYFVSSELGFDPELLTWLLALLGFGIGFKYDYEDLRNGDLRGTISILGHLGFALFVMSLQVLLFLSYFGVSA